MTQEKRQKLPDILRNVLDRPTSTTLQSSTATRDWPNGRSVFYNDNKTLFAWTNREDHLRVLYRDHSLDFIESFKQ